MTRTTYGNKGTLSKFVEMEANDSGSEDEMDNSNFPDVNSDGNVCDLIASTTDDEDEKLSLRPSSAKEGV